MKQFASNYGQEYFEDHYSGYSFERLFHFRAQRLAKSIASIIRPRVVLDIGCAKGFFVLALRELWIDAFGIDVSSYAIEKSPPRVRNYLRVVDVNEARFPFDNGSFELVTMFDSLEHLIGYGHALAETRRCLSTPGFLFVAVPSVKVGKSDPTHVSLFERERWLLEFRKYGFGENSLTNALKRRIAIGYRVRVLNSLRNIGDLPRVPYEFALALANVIRNDSLTFLLTQSI